MQAARSNVIFLGELQRRAVLWFVPSQNPGSIFQNKVTYKGGEGDQHDYINDQLIPLPTDFLFLFLVPGCANT